MDWENLQADENLSCSNYTAGTISNKHYTVIHHNAGVNMSFQQVLNAFNNNGTSAHYDVDGSGRVCQYVNDRDTAYHAGNWNANVASIGIEHANNGSNPWTISDATMDAGAHLVAAIHKKYGFGKPQWGVNMFPHSHFTATACPGELNASQKDSYEYLAKKWYDLMCGSHNPLPIEAVDKAVYRLYNAANGDHLYTKNHNEAELLQSAGYVYEGIGWYEGDGEYVYRVYNPNTGEHFLTDNHEEHDQLITSGWRCEGVGFNMGSVQRLWRLFNGTQHMYTVSEVEFNALISEGWIAENTNIYVNI